MEALWRRRTIRHVLVGLLPLLVVGPAVVTVLATRFADTAQPVREATGRAVATVQRSGLGPGGQEVELAWTDDRGTRHTTTVRAAEAGEVPAGREVELRYQPDDPTRVFVGGDETSARLRDLAFGMLLTTLVVVAVVLATGVHVARRLAAERRAGSPMPITYARSRRGIMRRSWLAVGEQGTEWWLPVHWDPVLPRLPPRTMATVHGQPSRDRVVVVDVGGTTVWQAGRRRGAPPGGELASEAASGQDRTEKPPRRTDVPIGLGRQLRTDAALLLAAPLIGLMWAYLDRGGVGSWVAATAVAAAVLFWLPTVAGADPT